MFYLFMICFVGVFCCCHRLCFHVHSRFYENYFENNTINNNIGLSPIEPEDYFLSIYLFIFVMNVYALFNSLGGVFTGISEYLGMWTNFHVQGNSILLVYTIYVV